MPFRNVAIVAHVDHGKTTLVDAMLRQSGALRERGELQERVMDTGDLEREKGITILAKNTAVHRHHPDGTVTVINVIDTPGHADFGGEVERGLSMVDGVLLLVDASEGPLPQTRFVLRKALAAHLPVILVVNKTDRPDARIAEVVDASHDLLLDVASDLDDEAAAAAEHALGLPTLYASGRAGVASTTAPPDGQVPDGTNLDPLFEVLEKHVPPPKGEPDAPLQALVTNLDASTFLGRLALIRIYNGRIRKGQQVAWIRQVDGQQTVTTAKITELLATEGVERKPTDAAVAGDIVAVAGLPEIMIGDTLAASANPVALPRITVDEPAISVTIGTNTSPLAGKVGGHKLTARMVRSRLDAELVGNVSIRVVDIGAPDAWEVQGRGELALAVLVEQMRREGFELTVGKPQVVTKTIDGTLHEPFESMTVDCPEEYIGAVTQLMAARKGRMVEMANHTTGWVRMDFVVSQSRPDWVAHRLPHRDPWLRCRACGVRRIPAMGGGDPGPPHRFSGIGPGRRHHTVRVAATRRSGAVLRRARPTDLRGHGRRDQPPSGGPRHQCHPGEEADQHALIDRGCHRDAGQAAAAGSRARHGVMCARRMRRGDPGDRADPQSRAGRRRPGSQPGAHQGAWLATWRAGRASVTPLRNPARLFAAGLRSWGYWIA
ncbi:GTP-binding translation elongation factor TYPA [Mycobacterium tuberculosis]|nr:GTP-binding translation elongation factor TYPA [Mycobacterium tuberculosis]